MREPRTVPVDGSTTSTRSERPLKSQSSAQMLTRWLWPSVRLMSTESGPPVLGQDHVVQSDPLVGERLDPPDLGGKGRVELMDERQPFAPGDHANPLLAGLQSVSFWPAVDRHCLFPEFLGLGVTAHRVVQPRQVVQRGGVVGMLLAQGLAKNLHRLLKQRLGLGVTAHRSIQHRQAVQRGGVVGTLLAQGRAINLHRLLVERLGLGVTAHRTVQLR